ncbi:hypothetical protein BD413DRAFT_65555 [Trametes elegans]|nr:hypothetical protein BD413DRAFT_65555 [Trametes elegans]
MTQQCRHTHTHPVLLRSIMPTYCLLGQLPFPSAARIALRPCQRSSSAPLSALPVRSVCTPYRGELRRRPRARASRLQTCHTVILTALTLNTRPSYVPELVRRAQRDAFSRVQLAFSPSASAELTPLLPPPAGRIAAPPAFSRAFRVSRIPCRASTRCPDSATASRSPRLVRSDDTVFLGAPQGPPARLTRGMSGSP